MTGTGVFFIAAGILMSLAFSWHLRSYVYILLFALHLGAALFMWQFTLYRTADAWAYYNSQEPWTEFVVGTPAVSWFTGFIRDLFAATYVDMYMIFHLSGYLGLAALYHLYREGPFNRPDSSFLGLGGPLQLSIFLPSLHVWTSGIGKDSLMFMGTMCFVWGALHPRSRLWSMLFGLATCFMIRPHVAALLVMSMALATVFEPKISILLRLAVSAVLSIGVVAALPFIMNYVGLQAVDSDTVGLYIEARQGANLGGGSSVDISEYPFPLRFLTYMYRPLFFDASGALGLIVSAENLVYLSASLALGPGIWRAIRSKQRDFFLMFNLIFWLLSTSIFATMTANLGIAMRQKTAFLPSFFLVLLAAQVTRDRSRTRLLPKMEARKPLGSPTMTGSAPHGIGPR